MARGRASSYDDHFFGIGCELIQDEVSTSVTSSFVDHMAHPGLSIRRPHFYGVQTVVILGASFSMLLIDYVYINKETVIKQSVEGGDDSPKTKCPDTMGPGH